MSVGELSIFSLYDRDNTCRGCVLLKQYRVKPEDLTRKKKLCYLYVSQKLFKDDY